MYKSALRTVPQHIARPANLLRSSSRNARKFLTTAPPAQKRRTWKSSFARWTLAAGAVYYYNTSDVFAEEPETAIRQLDESIHHIAESNQPTLDAILEEKQRRRAERVAEELRKEHAELVEVTADAEQSEGDGMEGLEEEADAQGAFNPETGEINWDCPCLGGMAHGPCGEEFKAAFSCFVYSNEEPKGMECIEKFKGMQDCFRQHPEMYGSELEDEEEEVEAELRSGGDSRPSSDPENTNPAAEGAGKSLGLPAANTRKTNGESDQHIPPATHDASSSNTPSSTPMKLPGEPPKEKSTELDQSAISTAGDNTQKVTEVGRELLPRAAHDDTSSKGSST